MGLFGSSKKQDTGGGLHQLLSKQASADSQNSGLASRQKLSEHQLEFLKSDDLFVTFAKWGVDYKGALCSGFSQRGHAIKFAAEFDLGKMFFPVPISIGFTATPKVKLRLEKTDYLLVVVCRQPKRVERFTTTKPICLMGMMGWGLALSAGVAFEIGFKGGVNLDALEMDTLDAMATKLEAKATLEFSAEYNGHYISARDPSPNWYGSLSDLQIRSDFAEILGPGHKAQIKGNILDFFDEAATRDSKVSSYKPERGFFKTYISGGNVTFATLTSSLESLSADLKSTKFQDTAQEKKDWIEARIQYHLKNIQSYQNYNRGELESLKADKQMDSYVSGWQKLFDPMESKELVERDRRLCQLSIWGHNPQASATAQVVFEAKMLGQGLEAARQVGVKYGRKYTSYRFQQFCRTTNRMLTGNQALVMTQDTKIEYKQLSYINLTKAEYSLGTNHGNLADEDADQSGDVYNAMAYRSAIVCWRHPLPPMLSQFGAKTGTVRADLGSGYSFGHSYTVASLLSRIPAQGPLTQTSDKFFKEMARYFCVSEADLLEFLFHCRPILAGLRGQVTAVLIEAAFHYDGTDGFHIPMKLESDGQWHPESGKKGFMKTMMQAGSNKSHKNLQTLRLRVRRGDTVDNTKTKFKLGFKVDGFEFGIELEKVERAGHEAVVDLLTRWYGRDEAFNALGSSSRSGVTPQSAEDLKRLSGEAAVPPVALIHQ